jgi:hypothetical protein
MFAFQEDHRTAKLLLLLLLLTAIELSVRGSIPHTSTEKTNKNKTKQILNKQKIRINKTNNCYCNWLVSSKT